MYTFGSDLARQRMQERMREAQAYRATRETRAARAAARHAAMRRVALAAVSVILWPIKH